MSLKLLPSLTHNKRKGSFTTLGTMSTCLSDNDRDDLTTLSTAGDCNCCNSSETSSLGHSSRSSSPTRSHHRPRGILTVRTQQESLEKKSKTPRVLVEGEDLSEEQQRESTINFTQVHFREYERAPGVNPAARDGVPLTLSWDVQNEFAWDLEEYEQSRPPRRERAELCIPSDVRHQMMRDMGYSRDDILSYVKKTNISRNQRNRTNHTTELAKAEEFAQKLFRGVLNKTIRSGKKKEEKKLLQEHLEKDRQMQAKYYDDKRESEQPQEQQQEQPQRHMIET